MPRIIVCVHIILAIGALSRATTLNQSEFGLNFSRIIDAWKIIGLSTTVVSKDNVSLGGFGYKDMFSSKVTPDTAFFIGSLTKAFTATLASFVLHEHGIRLKDRINTFYGLNLAASEQKDTNMLDLLSHRVGAGSYDFFWLSRGTKEGTDVLENPITHNIEVVYQGFRSTFIFSSLMYWVAGESIEAIYTNSYTAKENDREANRTWCDLMTYHVINEMNMIETTCEWRDAGRDGIGGLMASQIFWNGTNFMKVPEGIADQWQNVLAASGLISTARDMSNWIKFNLKLMKVSDELERTLKHTHELHMGIENSYGMKLHNFGISFYTYGYGLGWYLGNYRGFSVLYHDGRLLAHQNLIWLIPELGFGVYFGMTGGTEDSIQNLILLAMYLTDRFSGTLSTPWLTEDILVNWEKHHPRELYYPPTHPHMLEPLYTCNCEINKTNSEVRYCSRDELYYNLSTTNPINIHYPAAYHNALYGDMNIDNCSAFQEELEDYDITLPKTSLCMKINKFIGEIQATNLTDIYYVKPVGRFVYIHETVFRRKLLIKTSVITTGASFWENSIYKVCGLTLDPEIPPLFQTDQEDNFVDIALPILFIILPGFIIGILLYNYKTIYKKIKKHMLSKIPYRLWYKHGFQFEKREDERELLESPKNLSERQKLIEEICKPTSKTQVSFKKDEEESIFKGIRESQVSSKVHVQVRENEALREGGDKNGDEEIKEAVRGSKVTFEGIQDSQSQDDV